MAERALMMAGDVDFQVGWPPQAPHTGQPLLDESLGRLSIRIGADAVTRFRTDRGDEGEQLFIPTYHLAEWIAANWWALLFEPPKRDEFREDFDFRSRHWLGAARNGFALPDLWFCPAGGKMEIAGTKSYLRFAQLSFLVELSEIVETSVVQEALARFVQNVISRLDDQDRNKTLLHDSWALVRNTPPETEDFCQLIGSLGLSPYDEHPEIEAILDRLSERFHPALIRDLCDASDENTFLPLAELTTNVVEMLSGAQEVDLGALVEMPLPLDAHSLAWRRGRDAASLVRRRFTISNADPSGGDRFFDALGLDYTAVVVDIPQDVRIGGALERHDRSMHVAVLGAREEPQRRFAAARAAFLGWASDVGSSHLVTAAITRDQQASRAFAAEIIAPIGYIRTKARNRVLSAYGVQQIAASLRAPAAAVKYQAVNDGIHVV